MKNFIQQAKSGQDLKPYLSTNKEAERQIIEQKESIESFFNLKYGIKSTIFFNID